MARFSNRLRHRSAAAATWYDCSMLPDDETVFLLPHDQSRRFFANGHDHLLHHHDLLSREYQTPRGPLLPHQNQRFHRHDRRFLRRLLQPRISDETLILSAADETTTIEKHIKTRIRDVAVADYGDGVCVVCQDDLVDEENRLIVTLDCGHDYHVRCIKKWLNFKNTCPLCKATVIVAS